MQRNALGELTSSAGFVAGLADYGTRLKAVFTNIPTGVSVYVSAANPTTDNWTRWRRSCDLVLAVCYHRFAPNWPIW